MNIVEIARVAHEVNRAYCISLGDDSQKPWDETSQELRNSAITGVNFHLQNPEAGPAASHESWVAERQAAGWQYGEVKDFEKRLHPCLVPFEQLPFERQVKDHLFRGVVHAMRPMMGLGA